MTAPARGFPVAEYEGRLTRAQALMARPVSPACC